MFFCRLNVMQAQQRPTKRTKRCNIVFHSDTFLNVFCPHLTLDYQDKNALKSTKRCKNLKKPNLTKTHLKVPITSYNKITDDIGKYVYFALFFPFLEHCVQDIIPKRIIILQKGAFFFRCFCSPPVLMTLKLIIACSAVVST